MDVSYLAIYPEVQRKVQEELDDVIGRDKLPTLQDEQNLPYLCAVIYETIRFSSMSLFGVPHATKCDTIIEGYYVPAV
ncbi:putative cytochrome P450 1A1-like isoform X2 [Apostichopus japonicus]|uniref:Putative cytochrome P450 1A1-like isoform X2 n=1 Tax=Stichopus japonicus TaxID=307972 RepID=A0A2G8JNZ0_STIJA|nr:putative cytochrome P450 1A1-like isoform X2 [Apostichopus japonicus]